MHSTPHACSRATLHTPTCCCRHSPTTTAAAAVAAAAAAAPALPPRLLLLLHLCTSPHHPERHEDVKEFDKIADIAAGDDDGSDEELVITGGEVNTKCPYTLKDVSGAGAGGWLCVAGDCVAGDWLCCCVAALLLAGCRVGN